VGLTHKIESRRRFLMTVEIWVDGSCSGNPGPGGWAAILTTGGGKNRKDLSGGVEATTNNQMELQALIAGLQALTRPCEVTVYSDSKYVVEGSDVWLKGWIRRGWRTADNKPVKNRERWQIIADLLQKHEVKFMHVRGHRGVPLNEEADRLAKAAVPLRI
jgi:ribonuclease HI